MYLEIIKKYIISFNENTDFANKTSVKLGEVNHRQRRNVGLEI